MSAPLSVVPVNDVYVEPGLNARSSDQEDLDGLRASIARHGVLQPLLVRPREEGGVWLVAGHRRLAAAADAGLREVPAVEVVRERLEVGAVENLQRVALTPLEEARAFRLLADAGYSPKGIAEALGVARRRVTERLPILELTGAGQRAAGDGTLPLSAIGMLVGLTRLSEALADRVLAFALADDAAALIRDPGWVISCAVSLEADAGELGWLALRRRFPFAMVGVTDPELVAAAAA
jgi:ParB family chromosome partitioning protein